jgi:hypothetical protein
MVIIPFTRKRDIKGLGPVFNNTVKLFIEVTYLVVVLDVGLTLKKQLDKVTNKAYGVFQTCRGTFGRTWGLKPKVMYCIYTMVVRPIVTYAATVWWPSVRFKTSKVEFSKLQRMACLGITGAMKTAPQLQLRSSLDYPSALAVGC